MIRNIQLKHAGKYVCVVDTDVESLSAAAILIVKGKRATARHLGSFKCRVWIWMENLIEGHSNALLALPRKCICLLN